MFPAHLDIKQDLMEVTLLPPLSQLLHLLLIQRPPNNPLKLLLTDLLISLTLFTNTQTRLEPRLHADAYRRLKRKRSRITPNLHTPSGFVVLLDGKETLAVSAVCLKRESTGDFGGDTKEGFVGAYRGGGCAAEAVGIGGEISKQISN